MAISNHEAARRLYQSGSSSPTNYSHARHSIFDPRKVAARSANNIIEYNRLEAQERDFAKLCTQLQLDDEAAHRLGRAIEDARIYSAAARERARRDGNAYTPRTELTQHDTDLLIERYGERMADVVTAAATHLGTLLADKPALAAAIRDANAALSGECVQIACEAVDALGLVKAAAPAVTATTPASDATTTESKE